MTTISSALDVRATFDHELPLVRLVGELDLASAHLVADVLDAVCEASVGERVVVDLRGVTFCDLAGLRSLEACALSMERRGRRMVLRRPPRAVQLLVEISGVCSTLERR